jgi:hypothetical protein
VRNGLTIPRKAWKQELINRDAAVGRPPLYGCGSVLVLDPTLDLGIREENTTGSGGRFIFQVSNINFVNNTETNFSNVVLYVVGINNAILKREGSQYSNYLLTTPDHIIETSKGMSALSLSNYVKEGFSNSFMMGGGISDWFKKAKELGSKAIDWAMKHPEEVKKAVSTGQDVFKQGRKMITGKGMESRLFPNKMAYFQ